MNEHFAVCYWFEPEEETNSYSIQRSLSREFIDEVAPHSVLLLVASTVLRSPGKCQLDRTKDFSCTMGEVYLATYPYPFFNTDPGPVA